MVAKARGSGAGKRSVCVAELAVGVANADPAHADWEKLPAITIGVSSTAFPKPGFFLRTRACGRKPA